MALRFDKALAEKYGEFSRSLIQKYIKLGYAKLNNHILKDADSNIKMDDTVELDIPEKKLSDEPKINIIFENKDIIVIDKPSGILSHSKGALNEEFTVADFFKKYSKYNLGTNRPGIVHRLDRDTSGVMLGVKNDETAKSISNQFSKRKVKKVYFAIVEGTPRNLRALIDVPIGRNPSTPSRFRVDPKGKSAVTSYEVLESNGKYSLVKLMPTTGRTHQLRVHMSYIGHPILGDRVYGKEADRLYLHAASLEVTIPGGERKVFNSEMPSIFIDKVR
jgi:23S rRNA pseudouridine1911/1915/1917 synthase